MIIKIYSTPTCPYCKLAKEWLKKQGVEYEDLNVAEDEKAKEEMIEKSGQMGVPVVLIDGEILIQPNNEQLKKALKLE